MHIGFAAQNPSSHYWLIVSYGARERAAELGIEITTLPATTLEQQIAAINTLIDRRVDVLLLGPVVATGLASTLQRAQAAHIPIIVLAAQLNDWTPICTVRSDHRKGAELAASYVVDQIGGTGEVAHLIGPRRLQDNVDRAVGVRNILDQQPSVQIVFEQESPDWEPESGAALMRAALAAFPRIRGVCVANDTLALGALTAIEEAGRTGQIVVTGFDASPDALIAVQEGRLSASVGQSIRSIGRKGVDMAHRLIVGETVPPLVYSDISLVTQNTLLEAALESVYLLPRVLNDAIERGEALTRARDEVIATQTAALRERSTPLIPLTDTVLILPLVGSIDEARSQQIIETLLDGVARSRSTTVILDVTGVSVVDTHVADALLRAAQAVKLLGAQIVLTGIRPEMAQTLVGLGVDLRSIVTHSTVQSGIAYALHQR